ncbi:MAG: HD-GYP domain protein [Lachnospiraceae bacterium]|nr:HD-GYP domain protein [Lachnospiraceae bacterium]
MGRISETNYVVRTAAEQNGAYSKNAAQAEKTKGENSSEQRKTVFAGVVMPGTQTIMDKLQQAREKAWKVVANAWGAEQQTEETIAEIESHKQEMLAQLGEAQDYLKRNEASQEALRVEYGVEVDSQEYKDLQLLKKEQDFKNKVSFDMPTPEEQERLAEIKKKPLTEYQTRVLELNEHAAKFKKDIQTARDWMKADAMNVQSIQLERLKSHAMVDATNQADAIMEAAEQEVVSDLLTEGKEQIDEKMEKTKEEAKENAEKQEKKEEIRAEIELERAVKEAVIAGTIQAVKEAKAEMRRKEALDMSMPELLDMTGTTPVSEQVSQSLAELKASMKVLEADLKGIKVDEEI